MGASGNGTPRNGRRRSVLDLAPLERECMLALWLLGEGTVREIREQMTATRPRAYTTIMTIMDRLALKGVVARSKLGRAYLYRPNFSADEARTHAVEQLVAYFFDGSRDALQAHLSREHLPVTLPLPPPARAPEAHPARHRAEHPAARATQPDALPRPPHLDDTLL